MINTKVETKKIKLCTFELRNMHSTDLRLLYQPLKHVYVLSDNFKLKVDISTIYCKESVFMKFYINIGKV